MARPRKISDERIVAAAATAIGRFGPAFTLADVAAEGGVVASTLVHRFGSKRALLEAMMERAIKSLPRELRTVAAAADDAVTAIERALVERYAVLDDRGTAANHLAQLGADLADERLRAGVARLHAVTEAELERLVGDAVAAGELPHAPPARVAARILAALVDGTAIQWSARPSGSLRDRLAADVRAVLAGWSA